MAQEQQSCHLCVLQVMTRNVRKSNFTFYRPQWETDDDNSKQWGNGIYAMVVMEEVVATRESGSTRKLSFVKKRDIDQEDGWGSSFRGCYSGLAFSREVVKRGTQGK